MNERVRAMLREQAAPFLMPGDMARHVVQARRGENPWVAAWSTIARFPRLIVATDTALLVLSTRWMGKPDAVIARLPRSTRLGEPQFSTWALLLGPLLWFRWIRVRGERLWVASGDADVVRAIDNDGSRGAAGASDIKG